MPSVVPCDTRARPKVCLSVGALVFGSTRGWRVAVGGVHCTAQCNRRSSHLPMPTHNREPATATATATAANEPTAAATAPDRCIWRARFFQTAPRVIICLVVLQAASLISDICTEIHRIDARTHGDSSSTTTCASASSTSSIGGRGQQTRPSHDSSTTTTSTVALSIFRSDSQSHGGHSHQTSSSGK